MSAARELKSTFVAPQVPLRASALTLSPEQMQYFCDVIAKRAGISLKPTKHDLVQTRLRSRLMVLSLSSYGEYQEYLQSLSKDDPEWEAFTNLLTTNKTDFFREPTHFEFLVRDILPKWLEAKQSTFKVWSAASSTGEEAYTLAMVLDRALPKDRDFKILGTDIDTSVVATASNAVYCQSKKPEIPADYHSSCLQVGRGEASGWFRMKPQLKEKVIFRQHNLLDRTSPGENVFDLVLCRNVLIYFAPETIDFVQKKLFTTVKSGGHLFIGHSESLQGFNHQWKGVGPSIFKKGP